jgi:hypothetical protein
MRTVVSTLCFSLAGCVTATTTLQTAKTTPAGDVRLGAGVSLPISTRFVGAVVDVMGDAADRVSDARSADRPLTEAEQRDAIEAILAAILFQSPPVYEMSFRYGIAKDFDAGFRWAGPALRPDVKYRFLDGGDGGLSMAGSLAYAYHTGIGASIVSSVFELFEDFELVDYSRHDLDLAVLFSNDSERWYAWYGTLRYLAAFASFETKLDEAVEAASGRWQTDTSGVIHHVGGTFGFQAKWRPIRAMVELTAMRVFFAPRILGERYDLGGWIISPAIGLAFEW